MWHQSITKGNSRERIVPAQCQRSVAAALTILALFVLSLLNGVLHKETVLPGTFDVSSSTSRVLNFAPHYEAVLDAIKSGRGYTPTRHQTWLPET